MPKETIKKQNKRERILTGLDVVLLDGDLDDAFDECIIEAKDYIEELTTFRWETPEQYLKRIGEPWPDNAAVWVRTKSPITGKWGSWQLNALENIQKFYKETATEFYQIVIFNGPNPPPDDWEPEV
jgi:hypothetical protein